MALPLPWLSAAVVLAAGSGAGSGMVSGVGPPSLPLVESVVARVVNGTAETLASRRGFQQARPIAVRVVGRSQMRAARDAVEQTARSRDEERDQAALHECLGLALPPRMDGERPRSSTAEVSGLFDVASGRLLVANWIDLETERFALTRDAASALLARKFGLQRWLLPPRARAVGDVDSDARLARQALLAGDATAQALEHFEPRGGLPAPRALGQVVAQTRAIISAENAVASPLLLGQRLFVELDGLMFVARIRGREPWSAVDQTWRRPPQSTEQILHPDKYDRREGPDDIAKRLPQKLRGAWRVPYRDTLGELGIRQFLTRAVGEYRAERAAAGWGGDRALLLRGPKAAEGTPEAGSDAFAAWITTWDDDTDAEDFSAAAVRTLAALARVTDFDDRPVSDTGCVRLLDAAGRAFVLERRRRTVGILFAAPADADGVLPELMSAATGRPGRGASSARGQGRVRSK